MRRTRKYYENYIGSITKEKMATGEELIYQITEVRYYEDMLHFTVEWIGGDDLGLYGQLFKCDTMLKEKERFIWLSSLQAVELWKNHA